MKDYSLLNIGKIFNPDSVAIIGASSNTEKIGHKILKNIINAGYEGKIYPINPRSSIILGLQVYESILKVKEGIDVCVIAVPSQIVPGVIEECVEKGVKGAIIISSGFKDIGPEGEKLEKQILKIAKKGDLSIIGPNCQGVSNPINGFCATWPLITAEGNIAVISQSGTIALEIPSFLEKNHIGYNKSVALGNKADITEIELIKWLSEDPETRVIVVYTEGTTRGRELLSTVKDAAKNKPVIILKGGRTEEGKRAAFAHTGTLAGDYKIFKSAIKQSGGIIVNDLQQLYDAAKIFSSQPVPKGNNLMIVTSSGGSGILSSDVCDENGLNLPKVNEKTELKLRKELPEYCIIENPLDLTGNVLSEPQLYSTALKILERDQHIDMFLLIYGDPIDRAYTSIESVIKNTINMSKPVVVSFLGGAEIQEKEEKLFQKKGIPVYPIPERAINSLGHLYKYRQILRRINV
ncbi:acetate--CoA ligase family protein [Thermoproteota archaeon]